MPLLRGTWQYGEGKLVAKDLMQMGSREVSKDVGLSQEMDGGERGADCEVGRVLFRALVVDAMPGGLGHRWPAEPSKAGKEVSWGLSQRSEAQALPGGETGQVEDPARGSVQQ